MEPETPNRNAPEQPQPLARDVPLSRLQAQAAFLAEYSERGVVLLACRAAGIGRTTAYSWLRDDEDFALRFRQAKDDAIDLLEAEARRRAEHGWLEPVYQMGGHVGDVRKYDTALMALLLKGNRPEVYKDRQEIDQRTSVQLVDPARSTDVELESRILAAADEIRLKQAKQIGPASLVPIPEPVSEVQETPKPSV